MTIYEQIILYCLSRIKGQRTVSSVYHLLAGKRSAQTIQDAHLFSLTSFFGTVPRLTREAYDTNITSLQQDHLLFIGENELATLTEEGNRYAHQLYGDYPFLKDLDGFHYQHAKVAWKRLSLLTQVLSNLTFHYSSYIPIEKDRGIQNWVKAFMATYRKELKTIPIKYLKELEEVLEQTEGLMNPLLFVLRLSGFGQIGLTASQCASMMKLDENVYDLQFLTAQHRIMKVVRENSEQFPLLKMVFHAETSDSLTFSTEKTYQLLLAGRNMDEISTIRRLKVSTIQDHIVEIALAIETFNIEPFVHSSLQGEIIEAIKRSRTKQLKVIRQLVEADYFQIRLTLAKYGDPHGNS